MPVTRIEDNFGNPWSIWHIQESEATLVSQIASHEKIPAQITHPKKRLEWLAGRCLVKQLMENRGLTFDGIQKDAFGKPHPKNSTWQLSLSHSFPYVAAYLHEHTTIGIDLEQPKSILLNVAPRIFSVSEQVHLGKDLTRLCIAWCAKEVLVKRYGKKDLIFSQHIEIQEFNNSQRAEFTGKIIANGKVEEVILFYEVQPEFVLVLNRS